MPALAGSVGCAPPAWRVQRPRTAPLRRATAPLRQRQRSPRVAACDAPRKPPPASSAAPARTLNNLDAVLGAPASPPPLPPPPAAPPAPAAAAARSAPSDVDMWAPFPIPWDWPIVLAALAGVETCFLGAGLLAPALVLLASRPAGDIGALTDSQLVEFLSSPEQFWKILLTAELLQTGAGAMLLYNLFSRFAPFPEGVLTLRVAPPPPGALPAARAPAAAERASAVAAALGVPSARLRFAPLPPPVDDTHWAGTAALGGVAALGSVAALSALTVLLGLRGAEGAASDTLVVRAAAGGPPGVAALLVSTCVLAPVFEELVFRGVLLASLTRWMPGPAAVAASAVAFAAVHQHGAADSLQLLAMGSVAGIAYCKTRNLATPILVHALFNGGVLLLYGVWVNS